MIRFLIHYLGIDSGSGQAYLWWSGAGSDLGYLAIVTGIVAAYRHHNCTVRHCWRLGKPVKGSPYLACPKHHPAHEGDKRGVSVETIYKAHDERTRR